MTIASEISRLQTDKEAMRQAIIDKWVDVASNVSFDDYASCIDAIQQGSWIIGLICYLAVGWGGWGNLYGGWWWWEVLTWNILIQETDLCIVVWSRGSACTCTAVASDWWSSCIWTYVVARWGKKWCSTCWWKSWTWCAWWGTTANYIWWWWWGACWQWCCGTSNWWDWWEGYLWYWGGGWWWRWMSSGYSGGTGCDWWWNWAAYRTKASTSATNCWWWGGGAASSSGTYYYPATAWACGVVDICYPADWWYCITCATWWNCCYVCDWMCVHRFTSDWTFTIVN